jgi:hypothetical protein
MNGLAKKLALISITVTLLSGFSAGLYKVWSVEAATVRTSERLTEGLVRVASVEDEVRKARLTGWRWEVKAEIWRTEQQMQNSTNPYFGRKLEDLKKQKKCLEEAMDIKGKYPAECMQ